MWSDDPFNLWWASRNDGTQPGDPETAARKLSELKRGIAEAQTRTSAYASVIADKLKAGEDTEELERCLLDELDRLLELRLDYGALSFLSGSHGDPAD